MGTRDIKLYYIKEWQAITNVDVWGCKYDHLIKDIMKQFLPHVASVPMFRIECQLGDEYVPVYDNETLRRCLLLGDLELNMYVDVIQPKPQYEGQGYFSSQGGYYVEEVDDEVEVVVLDSDEEEVMEANEGEEVNEVVEPIVENTGCVESEFVMQETVVEAAVPEMEANEGEEFIDEEHEINGNDGLSEDENYCTLSSEEERDESYDEEADARSDGVESVDEEENRGRSNVPWTIMSDRQKGLIDAVQCAFPTVIQRFCLMHIEANFKLKFRGADIVNKLWDAGRATNSRDFEAKNPKQFME